MAEVLVTGASGFIGYHVVQRLVKQGYSVAALVRKTSRLDRLQQLDVELCYGEISDRESLRQAVKGRRIVFHVAGLTRSLDPQRLYDVNETGTSNICWACAQQESPPVLVIVSSLAAAGPAPPGRARTEADPPRPVSHYGRSKLGGEKQAASWASKVPITIVRPPVVIGPWDPNSVPMFKGIARVGVHLVPGWKDRPYSIVHVEDLVEVLVASADRGERLPPAKPAEDDPYEGLPHDGTGIYFASSRETPSWAELGRMIGRALQRRVYIIRIAMPAVWVISTGVELTARLTRRPKYLMYDKAREITAGTWLCSPQKAIEQLGFAPQNLQERIEQTARWFQEHGWL